MALTRLSTELLENIVTHVLPEGFESVALTCKRIYAICVPFIERHDRLRSHFHTFAYYEKMSDPSFTIRTAFDLITRIAVEPLVARYIRYADFKVDHFFTHGRPREFNPDVHCGDAVTRLLADSSYLKQAGLDWQEYYAEIEEDLQASRYSQYAAAFLLTLLPNVETLILPQRWKPLSAPDKLVDAIVRKTKLSHHLPWDTPSLAQTIRFEASVGLGPQYRFDLDWASPFLALPYMRSFRGPSCVATSDGGHKSPEESRNIYGNGFGEMLEAVHLVNCCIDEVGIADFLQHTTRLRTLRYSHSTKDNDGSHYKNWDICKFVTAIGRRVGCHLEELSISVRQLHGSIASGRASMCGFQRLRKLELPLEIAMCNITATTPIESPVIADDSTGNHGRDNDEPFIGDIVPASVSHLSLTSSGSEDHATALDVMFRHIAARKESTMPVLEEIHLSCPANAGDAYKKQCYRLLAETAKVGVVLHLEP